MSEVIAKGKAAKIASYQLIGLSTEQKNEALEKIAKQLVIDRESLLIENQKDLEQGRLKGFSEST
ncbi:gamma-glutamyl-phosphate reductase, partial [Peribacillus sp. NPDC060186]